MFNASKIIVSITKIKIYVSVVKLGTPPSIEKCEEFAWTGETIATVLQTIKKKFGTSVRILFSDEFVYVTTVKTDTPQSATRQSIQRQAQEQIPEDMNKTSWDYRVYPEFIQVAVLNTVIYNQITEAVKKADIDIEAIESCSSSLARLVALEKEPLLLVYQEDLPLLITVQNGVALTATVIHEPLTGAHVEQAVRFSQDQFSITIKKIIKTETIGDIFTSDFFKDISIESKQFAPALGMAMKTDVKTPDADSLNLEIDSTSVKHQSRFSYLLHLLFFCVFVVIVSGVYFGQKYFMKKNKYSPVPKATQPTKMLQQTSIASPSATIKKDYTVRILNGSGVAGEASRLSDILIEKKYTVTGTGNAEEETEGISVHYISTVDILYLNDLDKVLKTIYTTVEIEPKLASDEADITIIIGTFTKK